MSSPEVKNGYVGIKVMMINITLILSLLVVIELYFLKTNERQKSRKK